MYTNNDSKLKPWEWPLEEREYRAEQLAKVIRLETVRLAGIAKSGHFTSIFSCAEIFAVLYGGVLRLSEDPAYEARDRFLLSKGHAAPGLYPILSMLGYFPQEWLDTYAQLGSALGDHPDMRKVPGIDFSSGSLGHNLSVGLGMSMSLRRRNNDSRVHVMLGDQELNEGQHWEAAQAASHFQVGNLIAIIDRNSMGLDGDTEDVMSVEPIRERFQAFGWEVREVDGHNIRDLYAVYESLPRALKGKPTCIIANTVKGKGVKFMELDKSWHVGYLAPSDEQAVLDEIRRN